MLNTKNDVEFFMDAGDQNEKGFGKQSDLYMNLITEECIHEMLKEYDRSNIIGIADGIIDSIWVINGFINTFPEINKETVWNIISEVNVPLTSTDELIVYIIKTYADIRSEYFFQKNRNSKMENFASYTRLSINLTYLIDALIKLGNSLNLPMQAIWDEVARSNLSKIPEGGKVIKNESGKIQKPETYFPPNIENILIECGVIGS